MNNILPTSYQQFIHKSRYARWLDDEQRRENWDETVERYLQFMVDHVKEKHDFDIEYMCPGDVGKLRQAILSQDIMPSMRAMMTAGPALARDNICGYNCSYIPVDSPRAFDECMYILMCGTGVGFSVERENVDKLPVISDGMQPTDTVIKVGDSKPGWAKALRELIALLYAGHIPKWDLSAIRPSGARLKTMGGRASGPGPLEDTIRWHTPSLVRGGRTRDSVRWLTTLLLTRASPRWARSCASGCLCMIPSLGSVVSSIVTLPTSRLLVTNVARQDTCGALIPAARSSCVPISFATCQRWLSVTTTH